MIVVGVMSGTSADGADIVVTDMALTDGGELAMRVLAHREVPFPSDLQAHIKTLLAPQPVLLSVVSATEAELSRFVADAVADVVTEAGVAPDLVAWHGQTVRHDVTDGRVTATWQMGQPAWLAERLACPVLTNIRAHDVAAGGQGAPLVGIMDALLLASERDTAVMLNLGGIANISVIRPGAEPLAFDTGPANALIDLVAAEVTGGRLGYDPQGELAAQGQVDQELLEDLLSEPYYRLPPPKSTGKELFHRQYLATFTSRHPHVEGFDLLATVTALTAQTVADACRPFRPTRVIAAGGGVRNATLMAMLADALGERTSLQRFEEVFGIPDGIKEACLMALIGWLSVHRIPATLPSLTGANHPSVLGSLTPPPSGTWQIPEPVGVLPRKLVIRQG